MYADESNVNPSLFSSHQMNGTASSHMSSNSKSFDSIIVSDVDMALEV